MRSNDFWKAVELILEMGKIGESYHRVGIAHHAALWQILELRPLICTTGFTEKDHTDPIMALGSSQKNIFPI